MVQQLTLTQNNIMDDGAVAIATALETNAVMELLELDWNSITDGSVEVHRYPH